MPTHIQWADESWNPLRARRLSDGKVGWWCAKVSPACRNCYAEEMNVAGGTNPGRCGTGTRYALDQQDQIESFLDSKVLLNPLSWKKPRKIFPCSMTDLYGEWVAEAWLLQIYAVMWLTPQHRYIVLTKRPRKRVEFLQRNCIGGNVALAGSSLDARVVAAKYPIGPIMPLPNVIEMGSFGTQAEADRDGEVLASTPAAALGLSLGPLLEPIVLPECLLKAVRWVIVEGESGREARPCDVGWIRQLRDQCAKWNIPFFVKQLGSNVFEDGRRIRLRDRNGGDQSEWPKDLLIRQDFQL